MDECKKLIVYPDGFYSLEESIQSGPRPFVLVEFCNGEIIRVEATSLGVEGREVNIEGCLKALRELQENENGLLEASRLFSSEDAIEKLAEKCGGIDNLLLASALHIARHKTMADKTVYEALIGGDNA